MVKKAHVLFLFWGLFLGLPSYAQNSGFIGKRNIVSIDTRLFIPTFYNFFNNNEKFENAADNSTFRDARNLISSGLNFTIGRTLSNKFAFHLQGSILQYKTNMNEQWHANGTLENVNFDRATYFKNRSVGIMPILEISSYGGISPIGLSNQIGLGFYSNRILKEDYLIQTFGQTSTLIDEEKLFDYDNYRVRSFSLMYKINLRMALNRSILYNLGFRYNLNITRSALFYDGTTNEYGFTEKDYRNLVRRAQVFNFVSVETGFSFVF